MQKQLRFLTGALLATSLATSVVAQSETETDAPTAATVVATVNGVEILLGHMIAARATLPQQYQELADDVLYNGILEQLIQQSALAQRYEGDLPARVVLSLENERRSLTAGEVIEEIMAEAVSKKDLQAAYDAQFGNIDPEEEFNASHILVETEEEAIEIKGAIDGGDDFAATAREKSTGPSGPNGGELGWFGAGAMVPSFEAATIALKAGEVSAPVQTQFGWHIIKLNETRKAEIPSFEDVQDSLGNELRQQAAQQAIESAQDGATVEILENLQLDPALLNDSSLLE